MQEVIDRITKVIEEELKDVVPKGETLQHLSDLEIAFGSTVETFDSRYFSNISGEEKAFLDQLWENLSDLESELRSLRKFLVKKEAISS